MKTINRSFRKLFAITGVFRSRADWFVLAVLPAIPGQRYCVLVMLGTHGRYGLILGNRWVVNGHRSQS